MPLTKPGAIPNTRAASSPEEGANCRRDRDRDRDRARAREAASPASGPAGDTEGDVVPLPYASGEITQRDNASVRTRSRAAVEVWFAEAHQTAASAVNGSVWRARPASLRDREARLRRAKWAAGLPLLSVPGRVYGYGVALPLTVLLRGLEQIVCRPARLLTLVLAVLIPILLA